MIVVSGSSGVLGKYVCGMLEDIGLPYKRLARSLQDGRDGFVDLEHLRRLSSPIYLIDLACPRSNEASVVLRQDIGRLAEILTLPTLTKVIYASSQTVYGSFDGVASEESESCPEHWYDIGKLTNEMQLRMHARSKSSFSWIAIRFALLFTPLRGPRENPQFLAQLFQHHVKGGAFRCEDLGRLSEAGTSFCTGPQLAAIFVSALSKDFCGSCNVASAFASWEDILSCISSVSQKDVNLLAGSADASEFTLPINRFELDISLQRALFGNLFAEDLQSIISEAFYSGDWND